MTMDLLADNLLVHWVQAGTVAGVAAAGMVLLKIRHPLVGLWCWQGLLLLTLALPWIQPWQTQTPVPAALAASVDPVAVSTPALLTGTASASTPAPWLLIVIGAGVVMRFAWIASGVCRLGLLARRTALAPPPAAQAIEARLGVRPRYVCDPRVRTPFSFGVFRPTVALPPDFDTLAPAFQRAMLWHECLHVRRRDVVVSLLEEVVVALLWFHPWVWLLRARIRVAREQVVDAEVVSRTDDRSGYVRCLVTMVGARATPLPAAPMLRPRELRERIDALYGGTRMSRRALAFVTVILGGILSVTVGLSAAMRPFTASPQPANASTQSLAVAQPPAPGTAPTRDTDRPPRRITLVRPVYPEAARERGLAGLMRLRLTIDREGNVAGATTLNSLPVFEEAALAAVREWTYEPAIRDGEPAEESVLAFIQFPQQARGTRYVELLLAFQDNPPWPNEVWDRQRTYLTSNRDDGRLYFTPIIRDDGRRVVVTVDGEEGRYFDSVEVTAGGPLVALEMLDPRLKVGVGRILEQ